MLRFWPQFIAPVLTAFKPKHIVEIGAQAGGNTRNILEFCAETGAHATIIDPLPIGNIDLIADLLDKHGKHAMGLSLDELPGITDADAYLIDGDHNWYTVYYEIDTIIKNAKKHTPKRLPLLFFHDAGWPYGRRDLYYDPSTVPEKGVLPYVKGGLKIGVNDPTPDEGFNAHLCNATNEGTAKNGVLTAIEDQAKKHKDLYELHVIPGWHGLALMAPRAGLTKKVAELIKQLFVLGEHERAYLEALEQSRCELLIERDGHLKSINAQKKELQQKQDQLNRKQSELEQRERDLKESKEHYERLYKAVEELLTSNRWKIGDKAVSTLNTLLMRPKGAPAKERVEKLHESYEQSRAAKQAKKRTTKAE